MNNKYILIALFSLTTATLPSGYAMESCQQETQSCALVLAKSGIITKAVKGDLNAQKKLASIYENGYGIVSNPERALYWYEKAAQQGDKEAQKKLEALKKEMNQIISPISTPNPLNILLEKAYQGDKESRNALFQGIINGNIFFSPAKIDLGNLFDLKLIDTFTDVEIYIILETKFYKALPKNQIEKLYFISCKGKFNNSHQATYNLARMYAEGIKVSTNPGIAFGLYTKAADLGNTPAQCVLASIYSDPKKVKEIEGEEINYSKSLDLLTQAAEQGNLKGVYSLGSLYLDGQGVEQNTLKAMELWQNVAEQGLAIAQHQLGYMYDHVYGFNHYYQQALYWYHEAYRQGYSESAWRLNTIFKTCKEHLSHEDTKDNPHLYYYMILLQYEHLGDQNAQKYLQDIRQSKTTSISGRRSKSLKQQTIIIQNTEKKALLEKAEVAFGAGEPLLTLSKIKPRQQIPATAMGPIATAENKEAVENLPRTAEEQYAQTLYELGKKYENGDDGAPNYDKAREYYQESFIHGNKDASLCLQNLKIKIASKNKPTGIDDSASSRNTPLPSDSSSTLSELKPFLEKDHDINKNNHIEHYIKLIHGANNGDTEAQEYLNNIRNAKPEIQDGAVSSAAPVSLLPDLKPALKKKHDAIKNNHVEHYKALLHCANDGDTEAQKYLQDIRNSHPQKQAGREAKKYLKQAEEAFNVKAIAPVTNTPLVVVAPLTTPTISPKEKGKFSKLIKKRGKTVQQNKYALNPECTVVTTTMSTTTATTTSTTTAILAEKKALHLTPVTADLSMEPFIPAEPKEEKKKTKGIVDKKKKEDKEKKEKKSKRSFFGKKKKEKNTIVSKDTTNLIATILITPKDQWNTIPSLKPKDMLNTLLFLKQVGFADVRNISETETGKASAKDNKIVATLIKFATQKDKKSKSAAQEDPTPNTLTVHVHEKKGNKSHKRKDARYSFFKFITSLSDDQKQHLFQVMYDLQKDTQ